MAAGPLDLHPALRGWYAAGLRHVYFDDDALQSLAEARAQKQAQAQTGRASKEKIGQGPQTSTHNIAQGNAQSFAAQRQKRQEAGQAAQLRQAPEYASAKADSASNTQSSVKTQNPQKPQGLQSRQSSQTLTKQASTVPVDQWPMPWQERLKATLASAKGAPVLWTYWALGEDLGGSPNVERRDILRRILGELAMPRGTHAFWPLALPSRETKEGAFELEANVPIFLAGIELLAPRVCVVMGSKALRTILPSCTTGPYQQVEYGRTLFFVLPDMDMLLNENERIPRVVAYLRGALQPFARRS